MTHRTNRTNGTNVTHRTHTTHTTHSTHSPPPPSAAHLRRRGFTLIEVILAATIFLITAGALFVTFRTGIRAWRAGHAASEVFQTVRVAQDVINRDLHNLAYRPDEDYNKTYRRQRDLMAAMMNGRNPESGFNPALASGLPADLDLSEAGGLGMMAGLLKLSPPIDLSFQGQDGGDLDTISFTRHQGPRSSTDKDFSGMRRVKYFVKDGVLYREDSDPQGYHRSEEFEDLSDEHGTSAKIADLYENADEASETISTGASDASLDEDPTKKSEKTTEPLCEGVEIFNITYGYYRSDQWNEVPNWDSSRYQYRFPAEQEGIQVGPGGTVMLGPDGQPASTESSFNRQGKHTAHMGTARGQVISYMPKPDNLPGYVAVQLGVRDPGNAGKLRSFTIMFSCPLAREEVDPAALDAVKTGQDNSGGSAFPTTINAKDLKKPDE